MPISFKLFDMFHSNRTNFNMFVNGTSGMGKTTFTKKLLTSILATNNKVVIIDPQGEYTELANKLNGQIIDLGIGKNTIINPLQVRNTLKDSTKNDVISLINNHLSWLESFFKTLLNIEPHK
jgi:Type IV secretory pathway, VirB4 components